MNEEWGADTLADAISAQVHSHPPLGEIELAERLARAHQLGEGGDVEVLCEHNLDIAFAAALAKPTALIDFGDLYQEGTLAVLVAISEFVAHEGEAPKLRDYIRKVVDTHLDEVIEEQKQEIEADKALAKDAELFEAAQTALRKELGRSATTVEVAAKLEWTTARVELIEQILAEARELYDEEISRYLDDVEDDETEDAES